MKNTDRFFFGFFLCLLCIFLFVAISRAEHLSAQDAIAYHNGLATTDRLIDVPYPSSAIDIPYGPQLGTDFPPTTIWYKTYTLYFVLRDANLRDVEKLQSIMADGITTYSSVMPVDGKYDMVANVTDLTADEIVQVLRFVNEFYSINVIEEKKYIEIEP